MAILISDPSDLAVPGDGVSWSWSGCMLASYTSIHHGMSDPNFPPNLDIRPLHLLGPQDAAADEEQRADIAKYGIAGRVWEASGALIEYFTPKQIFDPPCTVFDGGVNHIIELGCGRALASLHLAEQLQSKDSLVLTDLPNVIPLCRQRVEEWRAVSSAETTVYVRPLAWGEDPSEILALGPFSHIILCDLIYFPNLYPPLLITLLHLTEPETLPQETIFGPEVIIASVVQPRTLALESSFFDAFTQYFNLAPIIGHRGETRLYSCRRWPVSAAWRKPDIHQVMNGATGVIQGRVFGLTDQMFGALEW